MNAKTRLKKLDALRPLIRVYYRGDDVRYMPIEQALKEFEGGRAYNIERPLTKKELRERGDVAALLEEYFNEKHDDYIEREHAGMCETCRSRFIEKDEDFIKHWMTLQEKEKENVT